MSQKQHTDSIASASAMEETSSNPDDQPNLDVTGLPAIRERMAQVELSLTAEYERLEAEWAELLRLKAELDEIRQRITSVNVSELDRLKINVGGRRFEIRATCVLKNTYFRSLLSGTFCPADSDGFYFICRDPDYVQVIMNFLRDGHVDLSNFTDTQLGHIRDDAEFYMVQDLQALVEAHRAAKRTTEGVSICSINAARHYPSCYNGVFFEVTVQKKDFKLHSIAFVAGERRKIVGAAYFKEGSIDSPGQPHKIGEVEQQVDKGQLVRVDFSAIPLQAGTYTIGVYSVSCANAISVCPRRESTRQYSGLVMGKSYHTSDLKGNFTRRAGEDEFDFSGELAISF